MAEALIALGGNVGDVRTTLNRAVQMFCNADVELIRRSSSYRTPPWGVEDQPDFVNACLVVDTSLSPHALLEHAQRVEQALGRDRAKDQRWGPRTIDIDILAYGNVTLDEPRLTLPHPRMMERAFVLVPLAEIAPDWTIGGIRIADALKRVDASRIQRLPPGLTELV